MSEYSFESATVPTLTRTGANPFLDVVASLRAGDDKSAVTFNIDGPADKDENDELRRIRRQLNEAGLAHPDGPVTIRMNWTELDSDTVAVTFWATKKRHRTVRK